SCSVLAVVPGTRPVIPPTPEMVPLPGPAARIDVDRKTAKLLSGQELHIVAVPYSKVNDRSHERVRWSSSAPAVAKVSDDGLVSGLTAGKATITATAGSATKSVSVGVGGGSVASVSVKPRR